MSLPDRPTNPISAEVHDQVVTILSTLLDGRLPKLGLTYDEAAHMLGVSTATVGRMLRDGDLRKLRTEAQVGVVQLASVLEAAGWPIPPLLAVAS